jgi:hypothetical protein
LATITFDLNSLTFAETIEFEDIAEMSITEFGNAGVRMGRAALAMAYITLRRTDPTLTLDDVRAMPIMDVIDFERAAPLDPTGGDASKPLA